jgi:hypothetical protein
LIGWLGNVAISQFYIIETDGQENLRRICTYNGIKKKAYISAASPGSSHIRGAQNATTQVVAMRSSVRRRGITE